MACPRCGLVHKPYQCAVTKAVTPVTKSVTVTARDRVETPPVTARDTAPSSVTQRDMAEERHRLLDRLAEIEAVIGPMSATERKRRQRARQRGGA